MEHQSPSGINMQPSDDSERLLRRRRRRRFEAPAPAPVVAVATPEADPTPEKPKTRRERFAAGVASLLFGEKPVAKPEASVEPNQQPQPEAAETVEQQVYLQAGRMRRFARAVIETVTGVAAAEAVQKKPLNTEPLVDAADDLRSATGDLSTTMTAYESGGGYAAPVTHTAEALAPVVPAVAERVVRRVQVLETRAEASPIISVAALALGAIAVILVGMERSSRRRNDRLIRNDLHEQQEQLADQQAEFARLRQEQEHAAHMARSDRKQYYEQLTNFTHEQASATREVTQELREVAPQTAEVLTLPPAVGEQLAHTATNFERHAPQSPERIASPLSREVADRVERIPSWRAAKSGVEVGGGAAGGVTGQTRPKALKKAPLSPAAMHKQALYEAQRAARQKSNAWLYGIALIAAAGITVAIIVWLG